MTFVLTKYQFIQQENHEKKNLVSKIMYNLVTIATNYFCVYKIGFYFMISL